MSELPALTTDSQGRPEIHTRAGWHYNLGTDTPSVARVDQWLRWLRASRDRVGWATDIDDLLDLRLQLEAEEAAS